MSNRLILQDRRGYPWGKVTARIMWAGGGQDKVWVNESGIGEFNGSGVISEIIVAGESLPPEPARVSGNTTVRARSERAH